MDGTTDTYLELAALPAVGATLLDGGAALVFAADGSRVLYANAAACDFLGVADVDAALAIRFSDLNPLKAQAARLSRLAPSETARLEMLRFGQGVSVATLTAACRRLNLERDRRALLVVAAGGSAGGSLTARAERLVDALGGDERLAAVLNRDGKVLAASDGYEALAAAEDEIDALVARLQAGEARLARRTIAIGRALRAAAAVRFSADGRELTLLVAGPPEGEAALAIDVASEAMPEAAGLETAAELMLPEFEAEAEVAEEIEAAPTATVDAEALPAAAEADAPDAAGIEVPIEAMLPEVDEDGAAIEAATERPLLADVAAAVDVESSAGIEESVSTTDAAGAKETPGPAAEPSALQHDDIDADEAAQHSIERGHRHPRNARRAAEIDEVPAASDATTSEPVAAALAPAPSNIVRLPGSTERTPPERLTGSERDAFRRIAEALGARHAEDQPPPTPPPARRDIAKAPAAEIDTRLLDRLPIGVVIFRDRRTLFANRALMEMLDYAGYDEFVVAGGAEAVFPSGGGIAGSIVEAGGRLAATRRDGGSVRVQAWLHAVSFGGATALMLSLDPYAARSSEDEDAEAMARIEARAEELEAILDTATDGVIVIDGRGRIARMNRAAQALFGVTADDFAGRYFTDLIADESQKSALDYLDGLKENGVASVLNDGREVIGRVPQGGLIPLFMTMGRIGSSDKFCAVLSDITHWKNVEAELTSAKRAAEEASAQKSDFLAKISHEIRTPLNAIIGFSELMMHERFGPIGNARYRDYLHDINVSGAHLLSLINDLLDLSKIEAGKVDLTFGSVAVNDAIQECVALMQPQANRERIIIRTSLSADVPNVVADQRSFRQILLNLMSNAVKFTRAGGQVIVSSSLEPSGEVVVRIRDTGIGMSDRDLETALKPFRQVAAAPADREHGTGLGLPLTKALVEANRASFAIESTPGQGTLVRITFPTTRVLAS